MTGRFDVVLGGIAVTDERRQLVDFTVSYHF
jgi:polar amino acid transport system substrate-binding protein